MSDAQSTHEARLKESKILYIRCFALANYMRPLQKKYINLNININISKLIIDNER